MIAPLPKACYNTPPERSIDLSVIDSLGKGFEVVARRWWLILIPVLLDTFLWLGPKAAVEDLVQETVTALRTELADLPAEGAGNWSEILDVLEQDVVPRYNAFTALRVGTLGIPSLITWGGARLGSPSAYEALWVSLLGILDMPELLVAVSDADFIRPLVWQIGNELTWLLLALSLTAIGIAVGSAYLTAISRSVSEDESPLPFWQHALRLGANVVLFWVLRAIVLVVLGVPFFLLTWALSLISPGLALLFGTVVLGLATWASFYAIFTIAALAVNRATLLQALWNSFSVVLRSFWPTLWLFVLINLIGGGLTILWQQLSTGSWWTWLAIVGNAYVGTSLVAASLLFYQDRYTRWRRAIAELLSRQGQRAA